MSPPGAREMREASSSLDMWLNSPPLDPGNGDRDVARLSQAYREGDIQAHVNFGPKLRMHLEDSEPPRGHGC